MVKEQNKKILLLATIIFVIWVYSMGGIPFLGALILFEEGNEIIFRGEETVITKDIDETTGENITETFAAITDVNRQLELKSKYITDATMRFFGTPGITNARIDIAYNIEELIEEEIVVTAIEENLWVQPANFTDIVEVDITQYLSGKEEGNVITFKFHSDNPGSLIISTFNVEWGPTQEQISLCESTTGTFVENIVICDCPIYSIGFTWETGCEFEYEETTAGVSGTTDGIAASPTTTTQLQAITPDFSKIKLIVLVLLIGYLMYYYGYEKGPKRGFIKK